MTFYDSINYYYADFELHVDILHINFRLCNFIKIHRYCGYCSKRFQSKRAMLNHRMSKAHQFGEFLEYFKISRVVSVGLGTKKVHHKMLET